MVAILIIVGIVVVLVIWGVAIYNNLVSLKHNRENAFADIDVQLKQRHDLVPQLLGAVKGYMEHERGTLEAVTNARQRAINATGINEKIAAEKDLGAALQGLNIQVEAYPDLKASANFMHLQQEIADIENKLAAVRRYFNSATKELNIAIQKFPNNIFAGMFGFTTQPMFDLGVAGREQMDVAPEIKF
ncbi:LemA family protein [Antarcticibacterium arcticum]|uniref:LemA family protein n=1 Tax=Antarcticibacterium arcticum TaxID=2585771 RepID=A0A5B8YRD2_9FLAO|nr:LemA family protein [Antarcticibacterium arcticum]QED38639.1 LemA family protein [Antarcticibacterium arcticum]